MKKIVFPPDNVLSVKPLTTNSNPESPLHKNAFCGVWLKLKFGVLSPLGNGCGPSFEQMWIHCIHDCIHDYYLQTCWIKNQFIKYGLVVLNTIQLRCAINQGSLLFYEFNFDFETWYCFL